MSHEHDDAIDKALAILGEAKPPEGMEARIAQRLAQSAPIPMSPTRRFSLPAAWWGGAITGAAIATFAVCAIFLLQRHYSGSSYHPSQATSSPHSIAPPATASPASASATQSTLCPSPAVVEKHRPIAHAVSSPLSESRAESLAPSRPAPPAPLTAQERGLLRLARVADPRELTSVNPENQARLQQQQAAEFDKFFNPPPPTIPDNE